MLNNRQIFVKRSFDLIFSFLGIIFCIPLFIIISLSIRISSRGSIFFIQKRVARDGLIFNMIKFRTMKSNFEQKHNFITVKGDPRITKIGLFLRKWKLDELPSLWNVLIGEMSFVGPRPDVPGYMDKLSGKNRDILKLRPGITGPATLKYSNEEALLIKIKNPQSYNDKVIFPDKVKINLDYMKNWSFYSDLLIIYKTIFRNNY